MRPALVLLFFPFFSAGLAACGISLEGTFDGKSGLDGGSLDTGLEDARSIDTGGGSREDSGTDARPPGADGSADGASDALVPDAPDVSCDPLSGDGWQRVAYVPDTTGTCPPSTNYWATYENPGPSSGTCSCGTCSMTQQPSCATLTVSYDTSSTASCSTLSTEGTSTSNGSCNSLSLYVSHLRLAPTGGACTSKGIFQNTASPSSHLCVPNALNACAARDIADCIMHADTQTCPDGYTKSAHVVGYGLSGSCADCGCAPACGGTVQLFTNGCSGNPVASASTSECAGSASQFASWRYSSDGSVSCALGAPPQASVSLTNVQTVCCR